MSKERKIFNFDSVLLEDMTEDREGFNPRQIGYQKKHIWAVCRFCGEPSRLLGANFKKSGSACHKECRLKEQSLSGSPFNNIETRNKAVKTNLEKYGTKYASQNKEVATKISKSRLTNENKDKIKRTCIERYGVENPFQSEDIKQIIRQVCLSKYGYDHHMKDPTRVLLASQKFNKTVETDDKDNYKLINLMRTDMFWNKLSEPETTLQNIADLFEVKYNSLTSTLVKDEFKERYYQTYNFPKYQAQQRVLDSLNYKGKIEQNTRKIITPLELDIYFPDNNFAIEFNGSHWHSEAVLQPVDARKKHLRKTKLCEEKGIRLFHIFEHQWLRREPQILNFLKSVLGMNENRIMARKCNISNDNAINFINKNHIQGQKTKANVLKYFNLIYDKRIVASMTASKHHRPSSNDDKTLILSRLCFEDGTSIVGGSSKLFKTLCEWGREHGYNRVASWSDNCWTQGDIYKILGFKVVSDGMPDYFYWDMRNKKYRSKQSQKKSSGCPVGLTEREWCLQRGLYRIWDCGKKRWEFLL